jgi:hypothetical protein
METALLRLDLVVRQDQFQGALIGTGAAINALIGINGIGVLRPINGLLGTFSRTAAALDAALDDNVGHGVLLLA